MLETLDYTSRIGSTPTFLYFDLLATDLPRRLRFAEWFIQRCRRENLLPSIIVGDEAAFAMDGEVNSRQYSPK